MHSLSALMLITTILPTINSLSCSGKDTCQCSVLSGGETCYLHCLIDNGCVGTTILCSDGHPCYIRCNGLNSCKNATIYGGSAIDITLDCWGGDYPCNAVDIIPQQVIDVTISCGGNAGCTNSNFICGSGQCTIDCPDLDSCNGATIDSSLSPTFTCTGNGCLSTTTSTSTTTIPTTAMPTTSIPTTTIPTTAIPTTAIPTTAIPTTAMPTTSIPTTAIPTTAIPTTSMPITAIPTTEMQTTAMLTTATSTAMPTTSIPTTYAPTTHTPTTGTPSMYPVDDTSKTDAPITVSPTRRPTRNPTIALIHECDKELSVSIQFRFMINSKLSDEDIKDIVQNITETFLNQEIQCNLKGQYNTEIFVNGTHDAIIDLSVCDHCNNDILTINNFNPDELQKDFIEIFKDKTDILFVIANSTKISVSVVPKDGVIPETTTTDTTTMVLHKTNDNDNTFWNVMAALMGVIILCVICLFVFVIYKLKMAKHEMKENVEMLDFATPAIQLSTIDTSPCNSPTNITCIHSNGFISDGLSSPSDINEGHHENNGEEEDDIDIVPDITRTAGGESCANGINLTNDEFIITDANDNDIDNEGLSITPGYIQNDTDNNDEHLPQQNRTETLQ